MYASTDGHELLTPQPCTQGGSAPILLSLRTYHFLLLLVMSIGEDCASLTDRARLGRDAGGTMHAIISRASANASFLHSNSLPLVFYVNAFIASVYILILHCLYVNKILCFIAVVFCLIMSKVLKPCNAVLSAHSRRPYPRVLRLYNAGRRKRH